MDNSPLMESATPWPISTDAPPTPPMDHVAPASTATSTPTDSAPEPHPTTKIESAVLITPPMVLADNAHQDSTSKDSPASGIKSTAASSSKPTNASSAELDSSFLIKEFAPLKSQTAPNTAKQESVWPVQAVTNLRTATASTSHLFLTVNPRGMTVAQPVIMVTI
jgi:hypothetical protein